MCQCKSWWDEKTASMTRIIQEQEDWKLEEEEELLLRQNKKRRISPGFGSEFGGPIRNF